MKTIFQIYFLFILCVLSWQGLTENCWSVFSAIEPENMETKLNTVLKDLDRLANFKTHERIEGIMVLDDDEGDSIFDPNFKPGLEPSEQQKILKLHSSLQELSDKFRENGKDLAFLSNLKTNLKEGLLQLENLSEAYQEKNLNEDVRETLSSLILSFDSFLKFVESEIQLKQKK